MSISDRIQRIYRKRDELSAAIQELEKAIVFSGFTDIEPNASVTNDGEVILEYRGMEMSSDDIEYLMCQHGCITPYDFD